MTSRQLGMLAAIAAMVAAPASAEEAAPAAAAPTAVSYADLARHEQFRDVKISPNGDYLAAAAVVDGKAVLSLIRLSDMKGVNLRPRDTRELASFWWVAPTRVMYTIGERSGALEMPVPTGELYAVNADGTGDGVLFGYRAGNQGATHIAHATSRRAYATLVDPLREDPKHALIAAYSFNSTNGVFPTVEKIDLYTGATMPVTTSPMRDAGFITDHHGVVRFAFGTDVDQAKKVWYRAGEDAQWELLFDENKDHQRVRPLGFNRKEEKVYFECGGSHGVGGVCLWDATTRKMSTLWSGTVSGPLELVPSADDKDAIALRAMPDRTATTLIDAQAPEAKLLVGLLQQFPGEDVRITSASLDGSRIVFSVSSDRNPGQFFLYDGKTHKASFLLANRPWIKPDRMAAAEPIALKARDGMSLHGYLTRPPGKEQAKNLPLVVYVHGGPYGIRDSWEFDPYVQLLATRGYAVLQVNFRGSGGYGFDFVKAGYREWGGKMQDDVTDATRWAVEQGIADPKRLCIFGGSYGGYAALEGAVKEPDLYRCAIGYVGVYDLRLMYTRGDIPQYSFGEHYLKLVLGENDEQLWDRSPVAHADRIKAKVMLIVGGQDWRVPPVQGEAMHSALNKAHIDHEWLYERTEGHGFYDEGHAEDLFKQLIAFLDKTIGPQAASSAK
ncbi:MAG TPA: S9 family peptidase [Dokdonella sp.]|nr:S9 family peptidase [Dokdonella sp.]